MSAARPRTVFAPCLNAVASEPPDEAGHAVEQLSGRPTKIGGFTAPFVEKLPAVMEGEPAWASDIAAGP
jgi:hypothetical protein